MYNDIDDDDKEFDDASEEEKADLNFDVHASSFMVSTLEPTFM